MEGELEDLLGSCGGSGWAMTDARRGGQKQEKE